MFLGTLSWETVLLAHHIFPFLRIVYLYCALWDLARITGVQRQCTNSRASICLCVFVHIDILKYLHVIVRGHIVVISHETISQPSQHFRDATSCGALCIKADHLHSFWLCWVPPDKRRGPLKTKTCLQNAEKCKCKMQNQNCTSRGFGRVGPQKDHSKTTQKTTWSVALVAA